MRLELPLLKETLDAGPTGGLAFMLTRRGTPWTRALRRRVATLYTKREPDRLAARAIGKLDRGETENRTSIPHLRLRCGAGNRKTKQNQPLNSWT
jgi:hypothetical protein